MVGLVVFLAVVATCKWARRPLVTPFARPARVLVCALALLGPVTGTAQAQTGRPFLVEQCGAALTASFRNQLVEGRISAADAVAHSSSGWGRRIIYDSRSATTTGHQVVATKPGGAGRGLSDLGGVIEQTGTNAAGGRIFTSTGTIAQKDFAGIVSSGLARGEQVHIITGAHGTASGWLIADAGMLADDVAAFGKIPGVVIHDVSSMTPAQIQAVMRGPGTIIGGFCNGGVCLAPHG